MDLATFERVKSGLTRLLEIKNWDTPHRDQAIALLMEEAKKEEHFADYEEIRMKHCDGKRLVEASTEQVRTVVRYFLEHLSTSCSGLAKRKVITLPTSTVIKFPLDRVRMHLKEP